MIKKIYLFVILFAVIILTSCASQPTDAYVQNGFIDLSKTSHESIMPLDGYWNFYWDRLVDYESIGTFDAEFIQVPKSWEQLGYPVEGYGTYHLKARVDPEAVYGIKLKNIATAYELY
ncbi:MAG: hypothetical protein ACQEP5_10195, partial [Actinomycetota bacterium]